MENEDKRRGRVTPENAQEAKRLRDLFAQRKAYLLERKVATQAEFGAAYGIGNQAAVGFFLAGKTALSLKAAHGFAVGLGVTIDSFSPRLAAVAADYGKVAGPTPAGWWPFERISHSTWDKLPEKWKGAIEDAAVAKWRELELDRGGAAKDLPALSRAPAPLDEEALALAEEYAEVLPGREKRVLYAQVLNMVMKAKGAISTLVHVEQSTAEPIHGQEKHLDRRRVQP